MLKVGVREAKAGFFDKQAVLKNMDAKTASALGRFGAFVRQRARSSIRARKKVSQPGSPPSSHEGGLRRLLFFAYDAKAKSVVIGPTPYREGKAPAALEEGGQIVARNRDGRLTIMHYRPRPFMRPAFQAELAKAPELWKQ
jgi:hypothetical protein